MKKASRWWLFAVVFGLGTAQAQVVVPGVINYQGKLMSGTNLFNGTVPISFRLYDAELGGSLQHEDSNNVVVVDGLYSTFIGDDPVWGALDVALNQPEAWIEVVVGTNVIAPRERVASVGYARFAAGFPANAVQSHHIAPNQITRTHIVDGAISSRKLASGAVSNVNLAAESVTSNKIDWTTMPPMPEALRGYKEKGDFSPAPVASGDNAIAMGHSVEASGNMSVVGGGSLNTAAAWASVIAGGNENSIAGQSTNATISGGYRNSLAENAWAGVIAGGRSNAIGVFARFSAIGGGDGNRVEDSTMAATIAGGTRNLIDLRSTNAVVGGGNQNLISSNSPISAIAGGELNAIWNSSSAASIGGGARNAVGTNAMYGTIGGGLYNRIHNRAVKATVAGGHGNEIWADAERSFVGGGYYNWIRSSSSNSTIAGGRSGEIKSASGDSFIGGGAFNEIGTNSAGATVAGGQTNVIGHNSGFSAIGGGNANSINWGSVSAVIGGGFWNTISTNASQAVIAGGYFNRIGTNAFYAAVGGGYRNTVGDNAPYATIPGGREARADNYGELAYASGRFVNNGDAQGSLYVLRRQDSGNPFTYFPLYLNGASFQIQLDVNETLAFQALVVGRSSTGESAAYRIEGLLEGQPAGGVQAVSTVTVLHEDDAAWDARVSSSVSPSQDALFEVRSNGEASVRWVATVQTAEVKNP